MDPNQTPGFEAEASAASQATQPMTQLDNNINEFSQNAQQFDWNDMDDIIFSQVELPNIEHVPKPVVEASTSKKLRSTVFAKPMAPPKAPLKRKAVNAGPKNAKRPSTLKLPTKSTRHPSKWPVELIKRPLITFGEDTGKESKYDNNYWRPGNAYWIGNHSNPLMIRMRGYLSSKTKWIIQARFNLKYWEELKLYQKLKQLKKEAVLPRPLLVVQYDAQKLGAIIAIYHLIRDLERKADDIPMTLEQYMSSNPGKPKNHWLGTHHGTDMNGERTTVPFTLPDYIFWEMFDDVPEIGSFWDPSKAFHVGEGDDVIMIRLRGYGKEGTKWIFEGRRKIFYDDDLRKYKESMKAGTWAPKPKEFDHFLTPLNCFSSKIYVYEEILNKRCKKGDEIATFEDYVRRFPKLFGVANYLHQRNKTATRLFK